MSTKRDSYQSANPQFLSAPCAIVMVGLPARGKTYMAKKLARYLNWVGIKTKEFSVGDYRRKATAHFNTISQFFDPKNEEGVKIREQCLNQALDDLANFLKSEDGEVGIYDATNGKRSDRQRIYDVLTKTNGFKTLFVESYCYDMAIVEENIRQVKISSPDYVNMSKEEAIADFKNRIHVYEVEYETLDEEIDKNLTYIKIIDQGKRYIVNKVHGHVESRVVYYLMNIHILPRTIYLTRHGESEMNLIGRIGGDGNLSERGREYAKSLKKFVDEKKIPNLRVWTSLLKRTIQTVADINVPKEHWKALNEIDAGVCEGMTYKEIQEMYPEEFAARDNDKYHYRYPGGESYQDLVVRLEPVIMELERQENVIVVCHQAVGRCLLAYFLNKKPDELPYLEVPLHTLVRLTPMAYGCLEERIHLNIDAVDTHRGQPDILHPKRSAEEALATVPPVPSEANI